MPTCTKHIPSCQCGCGALAFNNRPMRRPNHLRIDPSRTNALAKRLYRDLHLRLRALKASIWRYVVLDNSLRIKPVINAAAASDDDPKQSFIEWLYGKIDSGILTTDANDGNNWTASYVQSAFKQGVDRSYREVRGGGGKLDATYQGGRAEFLRDSFGSANVSVDALEAAYSKTYDVLEDFTDDMKDSLRDTLTEGMASGMSPEQIASDMVDKIDGMDRTRATAIARTEMASAQARGQLAAFKKLGLSKVGLMAELSTAGDDRVCDECQEIADAGPYDIDEAVDMLPVHPNCRCAWVAVDPNDDED